MKFILIPCLALIFIGCNSESRKEDNSLNRDTLSNRAAELDRSDHADRVTASNILDSIYLRLALSPKQITEIKLDTLLVLYPNSSFVGDTVYFRKSKFPFGIINFNDKIACSYKFLIVFDAATLNSTDNKDLQMSCDTEEGDSIEADTFAIMDDSTFSTTQTFKPSARDTSKTATITQLWKIRNDGKIIRIQR